MLPGNGEHLKDKWGRYIPAYAAGWGRRDGERVGESLLQIGGLAEMQGSVYPVGVWTVREVRAAGVDRPSQGEADTGKHQRP